MSAVPEDTPLIPFEHLLRVYGPFLFVPRSRTFFPTVCPPESHGQPPLPPLAAAAAAAGDRGGGCCCWRWCSWWRCHVYLPVSTVRRSCESCNCKAHTLYSKAATPLVGTRLTHRDSGERCSSSDLLVAFVFGLASGGGRATEKQPTSISQHMCWSFFIKWALVQWQVAHLYLCTFSYFFSLRTLCQVRCPQLKKQSKGLVPLGHCVRK